MAAAFQLDVLAASVPFFRGKCGSVVIPTTDGEYGVLAGHCNAVGAVTAGELQFETEEGERRRAAVAQGLFKIDGDLTLAASISLINSPPFVPMVAAVLKNRSVILPGIAIGLLGYVVGNYLGIGIFMLLTSTP